MNEKDIRFKVHIITPTQTFIGKSVDDKQRISQAYEISQGAVLWRFELVDGSFVYIPKEVMEKTILLYENDCSALLKRG